MPIHHKVTPVEGGGGGGGGGWGVGGGGWGVGGEGISQICQVGMCNHKSYGF